MIPKTIYYIWLGGKPLSKEQKYCIKSWKKFFPDYEIIEINETNFDIESCNISKVAYKEKWYNFVSDYARLKVIYENGGIYFDTDVEVIKDFRAVLNNPYFSFSYIDDNTGYIATGLGFACEKKNPLLKMLIDQYESWNGSSFYGKDGFSSIPACPVFNKPVFEKWGVIPNNKYQVVNNISFYPSDYFEGFDLKTRRELITNNTCTIHHYTSLGHPKIDRWYMFTYAKYVKRYGDNYKKVRQRLIMCHPVKYFQYHLRHKRVIEK